MGARDEYRIEGWLAHSHLAGSGGIDAVRAGRYRTSTRQIGKTVRKSSTPMRVGPGPLQKHVQAGCLWTAEATGVKGTVLGTNECASVQLWRCSDAAVRESRRDAGEARFGSKGASHENLERSPCVAMSCHAARTADMHRVAGSQLTAPYGMMLLAPSTMTLWPEK